MTDPDGANRLEIELIVACAMPPSRVGLDRIEAVASSVDAEKFLSLAAYHNLRALCHQRLSQSGGAGLGEALAGRYRNNAVQNLQLTAELISLVRWFEEAGVEVLPHKGPVLAQSAYGDLALREFSDLDLLIRPADLRPALEVLTAHGYAPLEGLAWLSPEALVRWTGEVLYQSARDTIVDLHWRLTPEHYPIQLDSKILWGNRTSIGIGTTSLPTITAEASFVLLAVHGAKHCWESLGWLADVAWLVDRHPEFDWERAVELAQESNCSRPVLLAAALIRDIFGAPLPDRIGKSAASDGRVNRLRKHVHRRLYRGILETPRTAELWWFAGTLAGRPIDSIRHLMGVLFYPTEADWERRRLPEGMFWGYIPFRAVRLLKKYSGGKS